MIEAVLLACSVCYGDPGSALSKGAAAGVLFLVGVVTFVLAWIATVIFIWARRARSLKGNT